MTKKNDAVMPSLKGSLVNVVPTKEKVDYDRIYYFNNAEMVENTFVSVVNNRLLNKSHINQISKDIETAPYYARFIAPIRIDINTYTIVDGQHRTKAFLNAWKNGSVEFVKVIFEDIPEKDLIEIIKKINSTNKNWGIKDYQHSLEKSGNEHIITIKDFGMKHPFCQKKNLKGEVVDIYPRYVYAVLFGCNLTSQVKDGTIKVTNKQLEFGEQIYNEVETIINALGYEIGSWFESFTHAWYNIRQNDKAYCEIIDNLGLDTIAKHLPEFFGGYHPITRKTEWEFRFRTAIYEINRKIMNKEL